MALPVDLELKKAFSELQAKMLATSEKIKIIDSQLFVLDNVLLRVIATQKEVHVYPPEVKLYESVGRMFLYTDQDAVRTSLKNQINQLMTRTQEFVNNKQYLEKNLKESQDNIREMVQQRKEQSEAKA